MQAQLTALLTSLAALNGGIDLSQAVSDACVAREAPRQSSDENYALWKQKISGNPKNYVKLCGLENFYSERASGRVIAFNEASRNVTVIENADTKRIYCNSAHGKILIPRFEDGQKTHHVEFLMSKTETRGFLLDLLEGALTLPYATVDALISEKMDFSTTNYLMSPLADRVAKVYSPGMSRNEVLAAIKAVPDELSDEELEKTSKAIISALADRDYWEYEKNPRRGRKTKAYASFEEPYKKEFTPDKIRTLIKNMAASFEKRPEKIRIFEKTAPLRRPSDSTPDANVVDAFETTGRPLGRLNPSWYSATTVSSVDFSGITDTSTHAWVISETIPRLHPKSSVEPFLDASGDKSTDRVALTYSNGATTAHDLRHSEIAYGTSGAFLVYRGNKRGLDQEIPTQWLSADRSLLYLTTHSPHSPDEIVDLKTLQSAPSPIGLRQNEKVSLSTGGALLAVTNSQPRNSAFVLYDRRERNPEIARKVVLLDKNERALDLQWLGSDPDGNHRGALISELTDPESGQTRYKVSIRSAAAPETTLFDAWLPFRPDRMQYDSTTGILSVSRKKSWAANDGEAALFRVTETQIEPISERTKQ